jgi:hypothetical protein
MNTYCDINDAYNNVNDDLDKLARELNLNKKKLTESVINDYNQENKKWKNDINNVIDKPEFGLFRDLYSSKNNNNNLESDNLTNITNKTNTTNTTNNSKKKVRFNNTPNYNSTYNSTNNSIYDSSSYIDSNINLTDNKIVTDDMFSLDMMSSDIASLDMVSLDSYIDSIKTNKNNIKNNIQKSNLKKVINDIPDNDCLQNSSDPFEHMKKCINCKKKLFNYLYNPKIDIKPQIDQDNKSNINEIIIIVIISIILMFILDFLMSSRI